MKFYITIVLSTLLSLCALSQTPEKSQEIEHTGLEKQIDSAYVGIKITKLLPSNVEVIQDEAILRALESKIASDSTTLFNGFRIRIFLDSRQGAREASKNAITIFNEKYPYINADRSYSAPNFKVSVGNFRTRLEAEAFLSEIISTFPDAFIVREKFKYPTIGKPDTRPLETIETTE